MIAGLISAVNTVIWWILGGIANVAYGFSRLSYYAADIPGVGGTLASWFASIAGYFNDLYFDVRDFRTRILDVLYAIDDWLGELADLISDVYGWITDKLDDAYYWADRAWDWIVDTGKDLYDDVYGWIMDRIVDAYYWAQDALDWIADIGEGLYHDVHGWIMDRIDDAYAWAIDARDWIAANADKLAAIPELIKSEVLQLIGPVFNLVSFFFEDINAFFSDPLDFILSRLTRIVKKYEQTLLDIADKIGDALFGD